MTPDAKRALSTTIRSLRARLLADLHDGTEAAYRLAVRVRDAGLDEAAKTRRRRLDEWIAEQRRAQHLSGSQGTALRTTEDFRREAEKQAAYTLLNRLVILRMMEAQDQNGPPLRSPAVATGGWESRGYKDFRELAPALVRDETEGYGFLLQLVFEELATELPGLYGPAGVADLIPIPAATLRHIVEALNAPALESCWTDDMTLGWVYQYWNDPEREALDSKLHTGGKLGAHEIASKTQMFTERYMVDWLLQNSLGPMWLAICRKHSWTPEVEAVHADGQSVLHRLGERRAGWRAKREAADVSLTDLMPLDTDLERRWAYYVPQPIPDDAVTHAPETVREIKVLDPAVGSGHFLVVAMDLLVALYREEARHRGATDSPEWTDTAIVERILSHNLHGIDLDPRAVQIAAAALWLKARRIASGVRPERLNLVASNLRLTSLADDDPALMELRLEVERETGIPGALTDTIVHALRGADHLGSLLKVDSAVDRAIEAHEEAVAPRFPPQQGVLYDVARPQQGQIAFTAAAARRSLVAQLETFLMRHTGGDDLGLRLRGEQLAAGVRFVRLVREGTYDLVVANPPYQGTSKLADAKYIESQYSLGKADLYAAFLLRGLQLARVGGMSAMLTMRNWMFIKQYAELREHLLSRFDLRVLHDLSSGAFEEIQAAQVVVSVVSSVFSCRAPSGQAVSLKSFNEGTVLRAGETHRKRAATLCHTGRHDFDPAALKLVPEWPLVYWWDSDFLSKYAAAPKLGDRSPVYMGLSTSDNARFLRRPFEVSPGRVVADSSEPGELVYSHSVFRPLVSGAKGSSWMLALDLLVNWKNGGLELGNFEGAALRNLDYQMRGGVAFTPMGSSFSGRVHRFLSMFDAVGRSVVGSDIALVLANMNCSFGRSVANSLNPSITFTVGDVERLPLVANDAAHRVLRCINEAFTGHESHREPSVEFQRPGPSPWRDAQRWAQEAVDHPEGAALPPYEPEYDPEPSTDHLSFAVGVALGRFGPNGEGILDPARDEVSHALPDGILFLDCTLDRDDMRDSLGNAAAAPLHIAWVQHGRAIGASRKSLREWLALDFFKAVHKGMYENRPIHWPLSSTHRTFVAWVSIHRFTEQTLRLLLADHLKPALSRLEGELNDLRDVRDGADKRAARDAEKRYDKVLKARDELQVFIANVEQCADRGAPPTDARCRPREQDAQYEPDLDDGVMINAAALWPLLEPQWKDPKKWWKELSEAQGRKDYDWSQLAMRYWPDRVDAKSRQDPSLGVAHGCFWRYHPERAWAWELRLQDEIGPDFRIDEWPYCPGGRDIGDRGSGAHRDAWLCDHARDALAAVEREATRRMRRNKVNPPVEMRIMEQGLWSTIPGEVWDMELRLAEKRGAEFRLLSPDEPDARAQYEAGHPDHVTSRAQLIASLMPRERWFDDSDEGDEPADDEVAEDEVVEAEAE